MHSFIPAALPSTGGPPTDNNLRFGGSGVRVELKINRNRLDLDDPGMSPGYLSVEPLVNATPRGELAHGGLLLEDFSLRTSRGGLIMEDFSWMTACGGLLGEDLLWEQS